MTNLEVRQKIALNVLFEIGEFCQKNKLKYFVIGGTLIGCLRHRGFIPWDDDIDIALPRPDYDMLLKLCGELAYPFEICHPKNDATYIHAFAKGYDASTTAVEDKELPFVKGVWIDIFPLDGAFENKILRSIHFGFMRMLLQILKDKEKAYAPVRSKLKKIRKNTKKFLWDFIPKTILIDAIDKLAKWCNYSDSRYVANYFGHWGAKESSIKSTFDDCVLKKFETIYVPIPVGYEEWLYNIYGDYMTPPPAHKRKPDHELKFFNPNLAYRDAIDWENEHI